MSINYYNSVQLASDNTKEFLSFTEKLDSWGDNLITPYRGRNYEVNILNDSILESEEIKEKKLTIKEKIKVNFGVLLKRIAALFNKEIHAKYEIINANQKRKLELFLVLKGKDIKHNKDGDAATVGSIFGFFCFFMCGYFCLRICCNSKK